MNPIISSHGYDSAKILFVQGYPLKADLQSGKALSGSSESTLDSFLKPNGLRVNQSYRVCYIKEKLSYSGRSTKKLREALEKVDFQAYRKILISEILDVNPNVVVPLDPIALLAVYPPADVQRVPKKKKSWLECYRGSILPFQERANAAKRLSDTIKVIPTYGPLFVYANWQLRAFVTVDFKRIVKYSKDPHKFEPPGNIWVCKTHDSLLNFLTRQLSKNPTTVAFDVETFGGIITCLSLCFDGEEAISIPMTFADSAPDLDRALMWQTVSKILANEKIEKIGQNVKYDYSLAVRHGFVVNNCIHDTQLKAGLLYPEFPKGLDFLTSLYTEIPYFKSEGATFDPRMGKDVLYLYNAKDALATAKINKIQTEELVETGMDKLYKKEVAPLIVIYAGIDRRGIRLSLEKRDQLIGKYSLLHRSNETVLKGLVNDPKFNPASPRDVGNLIYNTLNYPMRSKLLESGIRSYMTDKDTLDDLLINYTPRDTVKGKIKTEILTRTITNRKLVRVLEYLNANIHPNGRWCYSTNIAGTNTGRTSGSKTIDYAFQENGDLKQLGRSIQTLSKHGFHVDKEIYNDLESGSIAGDLREMFVPSPGCVFLAIDGSQAEARVVAVLCEAWEILKTFDIPPKIHARTAAQIFPGVRAEDITKETPIIKEIGMAYYDLGKRIKHAGNYAMEAFKLAQMTHLAIQECIAKMQLFHLANPEIRGVFHAQVKDAILRDRKLVTPFLRQRIFFDKVTPDTYRKGYAQIPQSTIGDLTKFTMRLVLAERNDVWYLSESHDELFGEVPKETYKEIAELSMKHYARPIDFNLCTLKRDYQLTIPAEAEYSEENWASMIPVEF